MIRNDSVRVGKVVAILTAALMVSAIPVMAVEIVNAGSTEHELKTDSYVVDKSNEKSLTVPEITLTVEKIEKDDFVFYNIPEEMAEAGGSFPEEMQRFTWGLCEANDVPYSMAVATIEIESKYNPSVVSSCGAKGYMQIVEKWHKARMDKYGLDDVDDPHANIMVGIDYLAELLSQYDEEEALVVYNCGSDLADSTPYSRAVISRKIQLEKEYGL